MEETRKLYRASYLTNDTEDTTSTSSPTNQDVVNGATDDQNLDPESKTWKKRYADLRSHSNSLNERVRQLEVQLSASQKQDIKIPSTKEEIEQFAKSYPDVFRNIRSIVLTELMTEREHIEQQTQVVKEDLERVKQERGLQRIKLAHKDFDDLNMSEEFHEWAQVQPKQIQDWLFEGDDPELCIRAIDLYKAERTAKARNIRQPEQAATQINTRGSTEIPSEMDGKRVWKTSEIAKMHPKMYEQYENEIEIARKEGRLVQDAA